MEPTYFDLHAAWTRAIQCEAIPGSRAEARAELVRLRMAKWTWFGEENELRCAIDRYLNGQPDISISEVKP